MQIMSVAIVVGIIISVLLIFGGGSFFIWRIYVNKVLYKYPFLMINTLGHMVNGVARIIKTKNKIRKFEIRGYNSPDQWLAIDKEPNIYINGKPTRVVAANGTGGFAYVDGVKIDKDKYLKTCLNEVEKSEMADAVIEAEQRHNPLSTPMKFFLGAFVILGIFMFLMVFFIGKSAVQIAKEQTQQQGMALDLAEMNSENIKQISYTNNIMKAVVRAIDPNANLTVELGAT